LGYPKKISQGREEDHPKIIKELEKRDAQAIAIAQTMKQHKKPLK